MSFFVKKRINKYCGWISKFIWINFTARLKQQKGSRILLCLPYNNVYPLQESLVNLSCVHCCCEVKILWTGAYLFILITPGLDCEVAKRGNLSMKRVEIQSNNENLRPDQISSVKPKYIWMFGVRQVYYSLPSDLLPGCFPKCFFNCCSPLRVLKYIHTLLSQLLLP